MQPQNPIVAPSGVIAVFLGIINHTSLMENQEAEDWLTTNNLIGYGEDEVLGATPKGRAWADMILGTPLPVQVSAWSDPRDVPVPATAAAPNADVLGALVAALTAVAGKTLAPAPMRQPNSGPIGTGEPAPLGPVVALPGFRPNEWTTLAIGQTPPGMQRDDRVIVQLRGGRMLGERPAMMAGQIIWKHGEEPKADDVMFYRVRERDDGITV